MMNNPVDRAVDQIAMRNTINRPEAPQPENTSRPVKTVKDDGIGEFPIRIVSSIEIYLGAINNAVTEVASAVGHVQLEDGQYSVFAPLSKKQNGIARPPLQSLFEFMDSVSSNQMLILADNEQAAADRLNSYVESIQRQLSESFQGELIEEIGSEWSIDRADLFRTSVAVTQNVKTSVGKQTVNEVHVVASVYIHAANLLEDNGINSVKPTVALLRNWQATTGVPASLGIVFDVSNFKGCPTALELFNGLLSEENSDVTVLDVQGVTGASHLSPTANTVVSIDIQDRPKKAK